MTTETIKQVLASEGFKPATVKQMGRFTKQISGYSVLGWRDGVQVRFEVHGRTAVDRRRMVVEYGRALKAKGFTVLIERNQYESYIFIPVKSEEVVEEVQPAARVRDEVVENYRQQMLNGFIESLIPLKRKYAQAYKSMHSGDGSAETMEVARKYGAYINPDVRDMIDRKIETILQMSEEQVMLIVQSRSDDGSSLVDTTFETHFADHKQAVEGCAWCEQHTEIEKQAFTTTNPESVIEWAQRTSQQVVTEDSTDGEMWGIYEARREMAIEHSKHGDGDPNCELCIETGPPSQWKDE